MDMIVRDPQNGYGWKVDKDGHGVVSAISESIQHHNSHDSQQAYQVKGTATPINGSATVLHVKNTSNDQDMVISYIRCQVLDLVTAGTALPNAANYFCLAFNRTYSSGGTIATPVNMNPTSGNSAQVTAYHNAPTLAGTALEFDVEYPAAEATLIRWSKEGAIILQPNATIEVAYTGDFTDGTAYSRISFIMQDH